ncbi:MAG: carbon-nitrogen hydrolase family protein [Myxococcales bacterium]|nr:carbon-nitrogen hydrolase family protein [Myxococcales bacterium]MCB9531065.1 carbon-nitrogen hydrolase family protein [Myxococcales bacterium]MCB9532975.1 carbon-nitrogen hydrolase family protein [Myxococcales bacterium]
MPGADLQVGVAQLRSGVDVLTNLDTIERLVAAAAGAGCRLVAFPENATQLAPEAIRLRDAEPLDGGQMARVCAVARAHNVWVLLGSFAEQGPDATHTYNTSVLVGPTGDIAAVYRKIHLFDVDVAPDTSMRESASVAAGPPEVVLATVDGWRVGLSICYDLRFPELYRALSAAGAEVLFVPAAFTFRTGAAHWHPLLRARAIENQCYVVAPAQVGAHYGNRESFGHALIVSPWGDIVAEVDGGGETWAQAKLSRRRVDEVRAAIPALRHRRM